MKRLIAFGVLTLCVFALSCSKDEVDTIDDDISLTLTQQILDLTNRHRNSIGLDNLKRSRAADLLAKEHTNYMIGQGIISHDNFMIRMESLNIEVNAKAVGENVAYGYATGETVMDGWLNSSGHKANIEGDYTHIGIAAIKGEEGGYYYMQLFYR